ncbi:MAG: SRPBCC family protein [Cytophagaceae bacterium]
MATEQKTKVTIQANINASVEKVWNCWNAPEHITKWNFASPDWHCPSAENDLRKGGRLKSRMEAKDGSFGFDFEAVYDEVINHKKISYTLDDGRQVITLFENSGGKTTVTTTFEAEDQHPVDFQKAGWQAILDNFKNYAESV